MKRLLRESRELTTSPSPDFTAAPLETNLFEWHFTMRGPPGTPYASGVYHGRIVLPPQYPLRPPAFRFLTPTGRFEVNREICLSISGHHEESWQPAWGIRTALVAIRAFMEGDARGQVGGVDTSREVRERYARDSHSWRCTTCGRTNAEAAKEMDEKAKEAEKGGRRLGDAEDVPEELKLAYRDDLEKEKEEKGQERRQGMAQAQARVVNSQRDEVPSVALTPQPPPIQAMSPSQTSVPVVASSQAVRPTRTTTQAVIRPARRREDDVILNRLDVAIAVFAAALAYMIVRKVASWTA